MRKIKPFLEEAKKKNLLHRLYNKKKSIKRTKGRVKSRVQNLYYVLDNNPFIIVTPWGTWNQPFISTLFSKALKSRKAYFVFLLYGVYDSAFLSIVSGPNILH